MNSKLVAVIGAGPSGLVTTKELLRQGHRVLCFEERDDIGGVFCHQPDAEVPRVWDTCRLTSSILVMSFSDYFPHWKEAAPFEHRHMHHAEYLDYLRGYADHFGLLPHILLGSTVVDVSPTKSHRWEVRVRNARSQVEVHEVDAVAACSGIHRKPYIPDLPGLGRFKGQVLHAAAYRNPSSIGGKSALFIGAGESGSEIVGEASKHLERSYLSLRRGVFVIPRMIHGLPNDYCGNRLFYSRPAFAGRRSDPESLRLRRRLSVLTLPFALLRRAAMNSRVPFLQAPCAGNQDSPDERGLLMSRLRKESGASQFETFGTKTEAFVDAIVDGRCELRPAIQELTETGATFADGSSAEFDSIVCCTGYEPASAPWLNASINFEGLYKSCFDARFGSTLAFVGFVRPPFGAIPPMAEMQARWFAQLLSGNTALPSAAEMESQAALDTAWRSEYFSRVFKRLPHMVDFSTYMDELAEKIGCKPRLADFVRQPRLLHRLYAATFCPAQYRFRGPHAHPELATRVLLGCPAQESAVLYADVALATLAGALGSRRFRPALSLRDRSQSTASATWRGAVHRK